MSLESALTFLGVVLVLTFTPGADMALVMRNVLAFGRPALWPTLAGIFSGLAVHVTSCVVGLSIVLARSDVAFTTIKIAGALYLVWLGVQGLRTAGKPAPAADDPAAMSAHSAGDAASAPAASMTPRQLYRQGFIGNLLNVKIALFYLSFLPQFAHPGPGFAWRALALAAVQAAFGFAWLATYGLLVARAAERHAARPGGTLGRRMSQATGIALIAFGVRLAFAAR